MVQSDPTTAGYPGAHSETLNSAIDDLPVHLENAVAFEAPELFGDYVAWLKAAGRTRGVDADQVRAAVDALASAEASHNPIAQTGLDLARHALDTPGSETPASPEDGGNLQKWRRKYLGYLLAGMRKEALGLLRQATGDGLSTDQIYLDVLAPTLRDVGWLWQIGRVTVAQEHFCTAVIQFAMASVYAELDESSPKKGTVLVLGPGDERHEVGARMVADLMERAGWNAIFLGANMPVGEIPATVLRYRADLVALSCTMTPHLADLRAAISALRSDPTTANTPVFVGGRPFTLSEGLWHRIGADGMAIDAVDAVRTAATLIGSGSFIRATV